MRYSTDAETIFSKIPIFQGLSNETTSRLFSISTEYSYKKKDNIVQQGDLVNDLYLIKRGMVNLVFINNAFDEVYFTSLSKYDTVGIYELFFDQNYNYTARALTDCEFFVIPGKCFLEIVNNCPQLQRNINYEIADLIKRSYDVIKENSSKIERRILNTLVFIAEEFGLMKQNAVEIKTAPNQSEMALMAGTTRETISRTLSALQKNDKLIVDRTSIVIPDYESFKKLTDKFN